MNRSLLAPLLLALATLPSSALAQDEARRPAPEAPQAPATPAQATEAPAQPARSPEPARPATAATTSCEVGDTGGFSPEKTHAWQSLLRDELMTRGKSASPGAAGAQEIYRLDIVPLDKKIVVRLTREKPARTPVASERAVLESADELLTALPRLVSAVSQGDSFEKTANVANLTHQEVRPVLKRSGDLFAGGTLFGMGFPGMKKAEVAPGLGLTVAYETPTLAAVADLRFTVGGGDSYDRSATKTTGSWASLSIGGRYFLSDADITPYAGGGFALHWAEFKSPPPTENASSWSREEREMTTIGLYGEVGLELLRTHKSRITLGLRLDLPMTSAKGNTYTVPKYNSSGTFQENETFSPEARYVVPISFAASYYFY